ncbi:MAG TPA: RraA family protein [Gaiellaceae bacterium]
MKAGHDFQAIPTTTLADILGREQVMELGIRPLWHSMPRAAGPAFTVHCAPGDNLMFHAAIYRAPPGSVVVVEAGDTEFAVAGGNVCAVAQRRGIAAFVVDGVIRDLEEVRRMAFPVFARGVVPIPGRKSAAEPLNRPIRCGGVEVSAGDIVVADHEGIVVVPALYAEQVRDDAVKKLDTEAAETLEEWEASHRARIEELLREHGFQD